MGFFDKLFQKKECSVCGGEIGLLGNRKLEDGNCCKECVRKLSPWFEERRHSTVEQIRQQLAYREENQRQLEDFRVSQRIGEYYKMYIEEENGVPVRFLVTDADVYMDDNPDIIAFRDLRSCVSDIRTRERELKQDDGKGNKVSYNPPRYEIDYEFYINMQIANNPYFDEIRFKLNSTTVTLETRGSDGRGLFGMNGNFAPASFGSRREQERYQKYMAMCQQIEGAMHNSRMAPAVQTVSMESILMKIEQIKNAPDLLSAVTLGAEVARQMTALSDPDWERAKALTDAAVAEAKLRFEDQEAGSTSAQETPKPKFCPNCGAPAEGGKFCQSCGTRF